MRARRYAHVPAAGNPRAILDSDSRPAADFCAGLFLQALRHGIPAGRRLGVLRAPIARAGLPQGLLAAALRRFPRRACPELDSLLADLVEAWPRLAERSGRLPSGAPRLSALAIRRTSSTAVFVFDDDARPLLLAKLPGVRERVENEAEALREAEPVGIAPTFLGTVGEAYVQEGLPGAALSVEALTRSRAARLRWSRAQAELARALARLGAATRKRTVPRELRDPLDETLARTALDGSVRRTAAAAWRDAARVELAVLRHRDTSPQNCLVTEGRLSGLVDWENAYSEGAPGFDVWNAAVAFVEHGAGLVRWSQEAILDVFQASWTESEFGPAARQAGRESALEAGYPEASLDALEVAFFARRLIGRVAHPERFATGPEVASRMLEVACGH